MLIYMNNLSRLFLILTAVFSFTAVSCTKPGDIQVSQAGEAFYSRNFPKTIELLDEALERGTSYSDSYIYVMKSKAYLAQSDYLNGAASLELAMAERPDYRELISLGMCYMVLKDYDNAEKSYRRALELNTKSGEAYASLGALYIDKNEPAKALENLLLAAEKAPTLSIIHANLAVAYAMNGDSTNALAELDKAEELQCPNLDEFRLRVTEYSSR